VSRRNRKYRLWLLTAQGMSCRVCGVELSVETATIDHIIPQAKGGPNELYNMQVLCEPCNSEKGDYCCDLYERLKHHDESCPVRRLQLDRLRRMSRRG